MSRSPSVNELRTSDASFNVAPSIVRRVVAGIVSRCENSAGRLRESSERRKERNQPLPHVAVEVKHQIADAVACLIWTPPYLLISERFHTGISQCGAAAGIAEVSEVTRSPRRPRCGPWLEGVDLWESLGYLGSGDFALTSNPLGTSVEH